MMFQAVVQLPASTSLMLVVYVTSEHQGKDAFATP